MTVPSCQGDVLYTYMCIDSSSISRMSIFGRKCDERLPHSARVRTGRCERMPPIYALSKIDAPPLGRDSEVSWFCCTCTMYPDIYQYMTFIVGFPPSVPPNSSPVYRLQTRMYKNTIYSNPHTPRAATKNDLDQQIPHPIRLYASRREKKGLKSSRDKNARHKREWEGGRRAC